MNKKGSLFTVNSIYILAVLFGLGILTLLVINPVLSGYIKPALLNAADPSIVDTIEPGMDFTLTMIKYIPYTLFFVAIIYLLILVFRQERVTQYE